MVVVKMVALVLSLGMDNLLVSLSLGIARTRGTLKIALAFVSAEALMPLVGLLIGKEASHLVGPWAPLGGAMALLTLAMWLLWFDHDEHEADNARNLHGFALLVAALSVSVDELAVGFSIGLVGVPVTLTVGLIAVQAFIFTTLGMTMGAKIKGHVGEWAEKLGGGVLGLLGLVIAFDAVSRLLR